MHDKSVLKLIQNRIKMYFKIQFIRIKLLTYGFCGDKKNSINSIERFIIYFNMNVA